MISFDFHSRNFCVFTRNFRLNDALLISNRIGVSKENGDACKDVDYTDHGRLDMDKVLHTHIIEIDNKIDRKKGARPYGH